jgi:hypothetical protein
MEMLARYSLRGACLDSDGLGSESQQAYLAEANRGMRVNPIPARLPTAFFSFHLLQLFL